jgi:uncharacterized membrane protein
LDPNNHAPRRDFAGHARAWLLRGELIVKRQLRWGNVYRAASYTKSALWVVPFVAILLVLVIAPTLRVIDGWLQWRIVGLDIAGAQALFETVITLTLSFVVFTFGSLLVAIQVAGAQLTPRVIATTLLRDNVVRYSVGLFVFTLVFAVMSLNRLESDQLPELVALLTAVLGISCIATFLFLIDYAARLLRPVSIVARVASEGFGVIESVYPELDRDSPDVPQSAKPLGQPGKIVHHAGASEIVLAIDLETLVKEASIRRGTIEVLVQVGDFLAHDEPVFALYEGAATIDEGTLQATVAFGSERTMEQDPMFAFRILVDVALKALSPAINDPTTAVLAIDQVHRLLRAVGKRRLHSEVIVDATGSCRVVHRTPDWEDYVHVAFTEIRAYGASNVQIARRLRAMLENLFVALPVHRHAALEYERRRLDEALEAAYSSRDDLQLARVADSQGLGGSSRHKTPKRG